MSFFDQRYYALNKFLMSQIGIWPEQPKSVRKFRPLTILAIVLSLSVPQIIGVWKIRRDVDALISAVPQLLCYPVNIVTLLNSVFNSSKMQLMLLKMEMHWKMLRNTSAVIVLHKYAEHGRFLTTIYTTYVFSSFFICLCIPMFPVVLDFVDPLNESRPKEWVYEAEYGVDMDKYYWPLITHGYFVITLSVCIFVAIDTMYIMWVQHACALFEIVGFNLKTTNSETVDGEKETINSNDDYEYKKMCECIIFHKEAISFADMIENVYSGSLVVVIGISTIVMSVTGLQTLINLNNPEIALRAASFAIGQAFHLFFNNVPGQKLIDHSLRVHNFVYDFDWYNMPLKAQKLLILITLRSKTPCLLTAGKIYVLSMESYSSIMQTAVSYFTIFKQLY